VQNPNELDVKKVLEDFDHVKKGLKVDDEGILNILITFLPLASIEYC